MTAITVTELGPSYVVVILDATAQPRTPTGDLSRRMCALLDEGPTTLLVDISRLLALSSDVMSALLSLRRETGLRFGRLVLRSPSAGGDAMLDRSSPPGVFEISAAGLPATPRRHR
jgi:hypothetical protein